MDPLVNKTLPQRLGQLVFYLGGVLLFVYFFLPFVTDSFDILGSMAAFLEENDIDPTRYYYTDVEQVGEAEHYLESVLDTQ